MSALRFRRPLRLLLAVLLVAGQAAPAGAVLCVAGEDHTAIEAVGSGRCHPEAATFGLALASLEDDGCPPRCKDTPLGDGPAIRSAAGPDLTAIATAYAPVWLLPVEGPSRSARVLPAMFAPDAPTSTARLRSTILLC